MENHPLTDGYDVVHCSRCGFVFADTAASQADYDKFYATFSKYEDEKTSTGAGESPWDKARLEETARLIAKYCPDRGSRILDIGCAGGGLLQALAGLGYTQLIGMDPAAACATHARAKGFEAYAGSLHSLPGIPACDVVVLSHVLEHVQDVAGVLKNLRGLTKPEGTLYLEVPDATRYAEFIYAPFQDFNTEHINHFSLVSLRNALRQAGFVEYAGGAKTLVISRDTFYPAVYLFCRMQGAGLRDPSPSYDAQLKPAIDRYIERSRGIMADIERSLESQLRNVAGIIIWGTGQTAMKILGLPCIKNMRIVACVDSNPIYHGKRFAGVSIVGPDEIPSGEYPILVTTLLQHQSIIDSIRAKGIQNKIILLRPTAEAVERHEA